MALHPMPLSLDCLLPGQLPQHLVHQQHPAPPLCHPAHDAPQPWLPAIGSQSTFEPGSPTTPSHNPPNPLRHPVPNTPQPRLPAPWLAAKALLNNVPH